MIFMRRRSSHARAAIPALLIAAALGACGGDEGGGVPSDEQRALVVAQLDSIYRVFSDAYRDGSVDRLMKDVYADDAFYLPPGAEILEGQAAFREHFSFLDDFESGQGPELSFEIVDRDIRGDLAYDIGYYQLRPRDAPAEAGSRGKFLVIWKRDPRGSWRIWADGYSAVNQRPAPATSAPADSPAADSGPGADS